MKKQPKFRCEACVDGPCMLSRRKNKTPVKICPEGHTEKCSWVPACPKCGSTVQLGIDGSYHWCTATTEQCLWSGTTCLYPDGTEVEVYPTADLYKEYRGKRGVITQKRPGKDAYVVALDSGKLLYLEASPTHKEIRRV